MESFIYLGSPYYIDKMPTVHRGRYSNLERELAEKRVQVPYQLLRGAAVQSFMIGQIFYEGQEKHVAMAQTFGLGQSATKEIRALYRSILTPLNDSLGSIRALLVQCAAVKASSSIEEADKQKTAREMERLSRELTDGAIPDFLERIGERPNIKAVIFYPFLITTIGPWRSIDFEFSDKVMAAIKAHEQDQAMRTLIEQMDIPITDHHLMRN